MYSEGYFQFSSPLQDGKMVRVPTSHVVGHGFTPQPGHIKDHHENGTNLTRRG